jgi:hypothetical protein
MGEAPVTKNQHVIPHNGKWAVKGDGNRRATKVADTKGQALKAAREIARRQGVDVVIHDRDGTIREDTYGSDPFPPRDLSAEAPTPAIKAG